MTLGESQRKFSWMVGMLILWIYSKGYEISLGEAWRTDEQAEINALGFGGRAALVRLLQPLFPVLAKKIENNTGNGTRTSLHQDRLAIDINLFRDGVLLTTTDDYLPIGEKWESMGGTWGGRFGDAPHFSFPYGGRK